MKTIIKPVEPQPVLADSKSPGRWIWGPSEPITDMCKGGNSRVSWWNEDHTAELLSDHCPIERPRNAKVEVIFDGTRWLWVVKLTERTAKKAAQ